MVVDLYKERLAAAPDQIREYRFLARAYLYAGAREEAGQVIAAGRKLDPDDYGLLEFMGTFRFAAEVARLADDPAFQAMEEAMRGLSIAKLQAGFMLILHDATTNLKRLAAIERELRRRASAKEAPDPQEVHAYAVGTTTE